MKLASSPRKGKEFSSFRELHSVAFFSFFPTTWWNSSHARRSSARYKIASLPPFRPVEKWAVAFLPLRATHELRYALKSTYYGEIDTKLQLFSLLPLAFGSALSPSNLHLWLSSLYFSTLFCVCNFLSTHLKRMHMLHRTLTNKIVEKRIERVLCYVPPFCMYARKYMLQGIWAKFSVESKSKQNAKRWPLGVCANLLLQIDLLL